MMRSQDGFALWITGWPGSGKSVLTAGLVQALHERGVRPVVLESDVMRRILTPEPTYTDEDRDRFYGMLADLAALFVSERLPVIVDATASRRVWRDAARARIPRFAEVFVDTPPEVCIARDPKGLYRAARDGRSAHVPGVQAAYEPPRDPEITLAGVGDMATTVSRVLDLLGDRGFL